MSGLVAIRRDRIHVKRADGETVRLPLIDKYEGVDGLPSEEAVAVLAHELTMVGESEKDFDFEAIAPDLLTALAWAYARRDEMAELFGEGEHRGFELASHVAQQGKPDADWLVPGVIAKGQTTLLQGREKLSGKSTLLAYLMAAMEQGTGTVFGEAFHRPVRSVWLSEEPEGPLYEKVERFGLGGGVLIVRNYALADRTFDAKLGLMEEVARSFKADHLVIDPLTRIARVEDEAGTELGRRAEEASDLGQRTGLAVTIIHHDNKAVARAVEDRGRGSTSLQAHVDQIIHVERHKKRPPRERELVSWGRVDEADWTRSIELAEDKRSYTVPVEQTTDALLLAEPVTVKAFAEVIGATPDTARRRLDALVEAGDATIDQATKPYVYSPVLASDDE
jgi:AAA domain